MKKTFFLFLFALVLVSCSSDDSPEFPFSRDFTIEYNGPGSGDAGFYVVKSSFEFEQIFGAAAPLSIDFTKDMLLIYISEPRSSSESYGVRRMIEQEINIIYEVAFTGCDPCNRDSQIQNLIVSTSRSTKPIIGQLIIND